MPEKRGTLTNGPSFLEKAARMRVILVLPRCNDRREDDGDTLFLPPLNLPTLAAITPPDVDVKLVDDRVEEPDYGDGADLVGITCITETANRAYEIAAKFRQQGTRVILGGLHPTLMPHEALEHADSVFCGDAFGRWEKVLEDARRGRLERMYVSGPPPDLNGIPPARYDLLPACSRYVRGVRLVNATRGCRMRCTFCSSQAYWRGTFRTRLVEDVVREIQHGGKRIYVFVDDDIAGDRIYARELFEALTPLRIRWVAQAGIGLCLDEQLVALAGRSGCAGLFVGFESVSPRTLRSVNKVQNQVEQYGRAVRNCHKNGICVEAGIVFGFDTDAPEVFDETLRYLLSSEIDSANINLVNPTPGTPLFSQLADEGRLLSKNWDDWAAHDRSVFQPKGMSPAELEAGTRRVIREFFSLPRILKRAVRSMRWARGMSSFYVLLLNLGYRRRRVQR
jgi:radical SAM superfamily enzyme YgiQ (UPF0313 family)